MESHSITFQAMPTCTNDFGDTLIKWVREANVRHRTTFKKCPWSHTLSPIDNLIRDHEIPRLDLLLKASYCREGNNCTDTNGAESCNVGASRYLVRSNLVV